MNNLELAEGQLNLFNSIMNYIDSALDRYSNITTCLGNITFDRRITNMSITLSKVDGFMFETTVKVDDNGLDVRVPFTRSSLDGFIGKMTSIIDFIGPDGYWKNNYSFEYSKHLIEFVNLGYKISFITDCLQPYGIVYITKEDERTGLILSKNIRQVPCPIKEALKSILKIKP